MGKVIRSKCRSPLVLLATAFALVAVVLQKTDSAYSQTAMQAQASDAYERHKQAAIRINNLAGNIHSEADADGFVSEIVALFAKELPPVWASGGIYHRVAQAEYKAVSDPAGLIPEEHLAGVWNEYVREIGAPDEAVVTAAEIHNMRDAEFTTARIMWSRESQTVWTMPNVFALEPDGKVAHGCRAVEAIRVIHDLDGLFQNLRSARERIRLGVVASEEFEKREKGVTRRPQTSARLEAHTYANPIRSAELDYVREHGVASYELMLKRKFDELFRSE
jgi:hypothetical protein